jgi:O-antigen ligase
LGFVSAKSLALSSLAMVTVIQLFALFLIISNVCNNTANIKCILISYLIGGGIVAYLAISSGNYNTVVDERSSGIVGNANAFALFLDSNVLILLWLFQLTKSKIFKVILACLIPVCFKLLISSGSRSGFLGFVTILGLWYLIFYFKLTFKKPLLALFVTIIMACFALYVIKTLAYTTLLERLTEARHITEGSGDASAVGRVTLLKQGVAMAARHPLFGVGLDNFRVYSVYNLYAHNNYIEILADTGFIGAILYFSIYICILLKIRKVRQTIKSPMLNMIIIYMIFDIVIRQTFDVTYIQKEPWIFLAIAVGYLNNISKDQISLSAAQKDFSLMEDVQKI